MKEAYSMLHTHLVYSGIDVFAIVFIMYKIQNMQQHIFLKFEFSDVVVALNQIVLEHCMRIKI